MSIKSTITLEIIPSATGFLAVAKDHPFGDADAFSAHAHDAVAMVLENLASNIREKAQEAKRET